MLKLWPNSSSNLRYSPLPEVKSTLIVSCFKYQNKERTHGRELTADDKFVLNISCSTDRLFANAMSHSTFDIVIPTYWTWQWFGGPVIIETWISLGWSDDCWLLPGSKSFVIFKHIFQKLWLKISSRKSRDRPRPLLFENCNQRCPPLAKRVAQVSLNQNFDSTKCLRNVLGMLGILKICRCNWCSLTTASPPLTKIFVNDYQ